MNVRRIALLVLALAAASCGDDSGAEDEPPANPRDAGRDARAARDARSQDTGSGDEEPEEDAATPARDANVRDARVDASTEQDAATSAGDPETGRNVGMTAAHNAVRAMVQTSMSLPEMTWSTEIAAYAQAWADNLAKTKCSAPVHRSGTDLRAKGYGENLFMVGAKPNKPNSTAKTAVDAWAGEVKCYTYGPFMAGDKCDMACSSAMFSDGCGHYTQVVWRTSTEVGCGVATCTTSDGFNNDIWVCNYAPAGNVEKVKPY